MIKAIIFDYGGVLSARASLRSFGKMYAPKFGADYKAFNKLLIECWDLARINKIDSNCFWERLSDFLKIDKHTLRKDFINYFEINYDVLDLIKKLKQNYKLGLLSNNIEDWLEEIIKEQKLDTIFDVIVTSYKMGIAKPNLDIYREIIRRLQVEPADCIYVDDSENNIGPAKQLGMKTILFKDTAQLKEQLIALEVRMNKTF